MTIWEEMLRVMIKLQAEPAN